MQEFFKWSSKWWPGVIPLVMFWAIAAWTSTSPLETDLAARTTSALKDTVLDKRRIAVAGRDVTFAADAFSEDGRRSAVASVEAVPGVRLVNDETRLVPEAKPFDWTAERDVVRVTVGGNAPLPASKGRLLEAPPYIFQAYKDPVAVTLTLTGYVPDNNVHAAVAAAAGRKFFSEKVVDNLKASVGAPSGFAGAVVPVLGALSRLSTGTLEVSDREVKLSGDALYDAAAAQIRAGLGKDFPQGWQFKADISVKPAAAPVDATVCQQLFSDLLAKGKIRFESGRATIDPDSAGLLDRLVETALRCPTANIEIAGHTDADGEDAFNQTLSEKRAQAVTDYLVKAGLPANRFTAVGYGSSQPVASNDTDQGKAQNRRIDFVVR